MRVLTLGLTAHHAQLDAAAVKAYFAPHALLPAIDEAMADRAHTPIARMFTYGTLRDDDDSGAQWTAEWIAGAISHAAHMEGLQLFLPKHDAPYPGAMLVDSPEVAGAGRLMSWPDPATWSAKLHAADAIEKYDPDAPPESSWYLRLAHLATVPSLGRGVRIAAWVYVLNNSGDDSTRVLIDDWLLRPQPSDG